MIEDKKDEIPELRSTSERIGQLYPILLDAHGYIIDGKHRFNADKQWRKIKLDSIKTRKDRIIARIIANVCRRKVSKREKTYLLEELAREYSKEGVEPGRISYKIKEDTGMSYTWVMKYLPGEYKDPLQRERRLDTQRVTKEIFRQRDPGRVKKEILSRIQTIQNKVIKIKEYKNIDFVALLLERSFYDRWKDICNYLDIDPSLLIYEILKSKLKELESELKFCYEVNSIRS